MNDIKNSKEVNEFKKIMNNLYVKMKEACIMAKDQLKVVSDRLVAAASKCRKLKTDENKKEVNALLKHLRLLREILEKMRKSPENQGIVEHIDDKEFEQYEKRLRNLNKNISKEEVVEKYKKYKEKKNAENITAKEKSKKSEAKKETKGTSKKTSSTKQSSSKKTKDVE